MAVLAEAKIVVEGMPVVREAGWGREQTWVNRVGAAMYSTVPEFEQDTQWSELLVGQLQGLLVE